MPLDELIKVLGNDLGLKQLNLDSVTNAIRLQFNDELEVEFEEPHSREYIFIHSVVGHLSTDCSKAILLHIAHANLFGQETGGAVLGYDAAKEELLLFMRFHSCDVSYQMFRMEFERFLSALRKWRLQLQNYNMRPGDERAITDFGESSSLSFVKV
jgi:hypothetical protein